VSRTCPAGHPTTASDYCDTCGAPLGAEAGGGLAGAGLAGGGAAETGAAAASRPAGNPACPHCQAPNPAGALFCESCGYDFTTGALPRGAAGGASGEPATTPDATAGAAPGAPTMISPAPEPPGWVAEVWVDPDWYAEQDSEEPCPSSGLPAVVPLTARGALIGRRSSSRNVYPEIDCSPDVGVSRRQAELSTDGTRWWIEDLESANGSYVGSAAGPLPTQPLTPGQRRELAEDDRVYVGAWSRIVIRPSTEEERSQ
jgi:hypothetical protein